MSYFRGLADDEIQMPPVVKTGPGGAHFDLNPEAPASSGSGLDSFLASLGLKAPTMPLNIGASLPGKAPAKAPTPAPSRLPLVLGIAGVAGVGYLLFKRRVVAANPGRRRRRARRR
jgi:hypothetical protein